MEKTTLKTELEKYLAEHDPALAFPEDKPCLKCGVVTALPENGICLDCESRGEQVQVQGDKLIRDWERLLGGPEAVRKYDFSTYRVRTGAEKAVEFARAFSPSQSVYFYGHPGGGKDHLAKAMIKPWHFQGKKIVATTAKRMIRDLRDNHFDDEARIIKDCIEADIFYLAEVGFGQDTVFAMSTFCEILDGRLDAGKSGNIFTSNLSLRDLEMNQKDSRLVSRIIGFVKKNELKVAPLDALGKPIDWRRI